MWHEDDAAGTAVQGAGFDPDAATEPDRASGAALRRVTGACTTARDAAESRILGSESVKQHARDEVFKVGSLLHPRMDRFANPIRRYAVNQDHVCSAVVNQRLE